MKAQGVLHQSSGDLIADRRYGFGEAAYGAGDFIAARDLYLQTLEVVPHWPPAHVALGKAYLALNAFDDARAAFEAARALDREDRLGAGLYLRRLAPGSVAGPVMSGPFIAGLFDGYASRFEHHLVEGLHYSAPALLQVALSEAGFGRAKIALDLGCGTGLMGDAIGAATDRLIGIDLSAGMLARAREKGRYQALHCLSLQDYLARASEEGPFDLVLAADVFCYLEALAAIFDLVRARMIREGFFAFTIQRHDGSGVVLGEDHRFHHAPDEVAAQLQATGFDVVLARAITARLDRGIGVPGFLLCVRAR